MFLDIKKKERKKERKKEMFGFVLFCSQMLSVKLR